jgi:hypothetical protein
MRAIDRPYAPSGIRTCGARLALLNLCPNLCPRDAPVPALTRPGLPSQARNDAEQPSESDLQNRGFSFESCRVVTSVVTSSTLDDVQRVGGTRKGAASSAFLVLGRAGFEPATLGLKVRRAGLGRSQPGGANALQDFSAAPASRRGLSATPDTQDVHVGGLVSTAEAR